jgi:hypothetical protein
MSFSPFAANKQVFAEDAVTFVLQLWRQLAFEAAAYIAGLDTGSMMV